MLITSYLTPYAYWCRRRFSPRNRCGIYWISPLLHWFNTYDFSYNIQNLQAIRTLSYVMNWPNVLLTERLHKFNWLPSDLLSVSNLLASLEIHSLFISPLIYLVLSASPFTWSVTALCWLKLRHQLFEACMTIGSYAFSSLFPKARNSLLSSVFASSSVLAFKHYRRACLIPTAFSLYREPPVPHFCARYANRIVCKYVLYVRMFENVCRKYVAILEIPKVLQYSLWISKLYIQITWKEAKLRMNPMYRFWEIFCIHRVLKIDLWLVSM